MPRFERPVISRAAMQRDKIRKEQLQYQAVAPEFADQRRVTIAAKQTKRMCNVNVVVKGKKS